jgi:hypothetical protein
MVVRGRILRSWLLGLYIAAQVIGLLPLIYEHTSNIYKDLPIAGHVQLSSNTAQDNSERQHGLIGFHDECCAIYSLAGPLPPAVSLALEECATMRVSPAELVALVSWHSARLDRPPKAPPLV